MPRLTRREAVLTAGLGVTGVAAAALPGLSHAAPVTLDPAARQRDLRVLENLLRTEQLLQYAYGRVLRSWSFNSSTQGVLELVARHEDEHAALLQREIAALAAGLSPSAQAAARPSRSNPAMNTVRTALGQAQTPRDGLRVLSKVESLAEANYFNSVSQLQSPDLALTAAQILASEAQHWSLLLNVLTEGAMPDTVPQAFVRGVAEISAG